MQILDFAKRQRDEYIGSELELIWFERDPGKKNRMTSHGRVDLNMYSMDTLNLFLSDLLS